MDPSSSKKMDVDDDSSDDSFSRMREMTKKMQMTPEYMEAMCHPMMHHRRMMQDFEFGFEEMMNLGPMGEKMGMHDLRKMGRGMRFPPRRNEFTITCNSLVPEYGTVIAENIRYFNALLHKIADTIEIPAKNIEVYRDAEKEKQVKWDEEYEKLIDGGKSVTVFYLPTPDFDDIIKYEELGHGPFGSVYRCSKFGSKEMFVLKKYKNVNDKDEELRKLMVEFSIYEKLGDHPRILKCNGYFRSAKASYIKLDYMAKGSLRAWLKANGAQKEPSIIRFSKQILEALDFLHSQNILHRDLKGPKILLDDNLDIKLCGFMSAKVFPDISSENFRNHAADSNHGTANWTAPEVINGEGYGSSADIWSFGAVMVELITGKAPLFFLASFQAIYRLGTQKKIEFAYPLKCSDALKSFVDPCLDPDPTKRPTVKQLLAHEFLQSCTEASQEAV